MSECGDLSAWIAIWGVLAILAIMRVNTQRDARDRGEVRPTRLVAPSTIASCVLLGLLALLVILLSLPILIPLAASLEIMNWTRQ